MNERIKDEPKPTHRPKEGAPLETIGYHMRVIFHPVIRLESKKGWEFGQKLADFIEPSQSNLKADEWTFIQPQGASPNSFLTVTVRPSDVQLNATFPAHGKEWYETRYLLLLKKFADFFKPELILESSAMIRGTVPVDGDARTFLAGHVMNMSPNRTDPFGGQSI